MLLEDYCSERSPAGPSGENLEYDPGYIALFMAAQPKEERQAGNEIIPGEDPNFKDVTEKALAILERSHDLRVSFLLAKAQLSLGGLEALVGPISYTRTCLETFWDTCHPMLDADDDNDPTIRINAVAELASRDMLRRFRLAPLTDSPMFGRMNLRDLAIIDGEMAPPAGMANVPDKAKLSAALTDTKSDVLASRLVALKQMIADCAAIMAVFDTHTPGDGPDLEPLVKLLKRAAKLISEAMGEPQGEAVGGAGGDAAGGAVAGLAGQVAVPGAAPAGVPGAINSSADVRIMLDRIIEYYARSEPSSPLPLLLVRARRLIGADFMTIMKDLAPSGVESVNTIFGAEETD